MSMFSFIAGDKPFDEFSIGIQVLNKNAVRIEEGHYLNIYKEEDRYYSSVYTSRPYIMGIEFDNFSNVAEALLEYIKGHMEQHKSIELWNMWMDEKEEPEHRSCNVTKLSVEVLNWIYGIEEYDHPQCLKIYKWSR